MPRDSSGNFSLDGSNPVQAGETIFADGWAVPTLNDVAQALTDSLSRNGDGPMLATLVTVDGTLSDPAVQFGTENPPNGIYHDPLEAPSGAIIFLIDGVATMRLRSNGIIETSTDGNTWNSIGAPSVQTTSPTGSLGAIWVDPSTNTTYFFYDEPALALGGTSQAWVPFNLTNVSTPENATVLAFPDAPTDGQVYDAVAINGEQYTWSTAKNRWEYAPALNGTAELDGFTYLGFERITATGAGTWDPANFPDTDMIQVELQGAGGSGGGAIDSSGALEASAGGGAGGGGFAKYQFLIGTDIVAPVNYDVGVGALGADGLNGLTGGSTIWGAENAAGGSGGAVGAFPNLLWRSAGGPGGNFSDIGGNLIFGANGGVGIAGFTTGGSDGRATGGPAGGSYFSGGRTPPSYSSNDTAGNAGIGHGCGGTGARNSLTATTFAGGAGVDGIIIVHRFAKETINIIGANKPIISSDGSLHFDASGNSIDITDVVNTAPVAGDNVIIPPAGDLALAIQSGVVGAGIGTPFQEWRNDQGDLIGAFEVRATNLLGAIRMGTIGAAGQDIGGGYIGGSGQIFLANELGMTNPFITIDSSVAYAGDLMNFRKDAVAVFTVDSGGAVKSGESSTGAAGGYVLGSDGRLIIKPKTNIQAILMRGSDGQTASMLDIRTHDNDVLFTVGALGHLFITPLGTGNPIITGDAPLGQTANLIELKNDGDLRFRVQPNGRLVLSGGIQNDPTLTNLIHIDLNGPAGQTVSFIDARLDGDVKFIVSNLGRVQAQGSYDQTTAVAANLNIGSTGVLLRTTSSGQFKVNRAPVSDGLLAILSLNPITFDSTHEGDEGIRFCGFVAEEVASVIPEASQDEGENYDSRALIAALVSSVQELTARLEALENA